MVQKQCSSDDDETTVFQSGLGVVAVLLAWRGFGYLD